MKDPVTKFDFAAAFKALDDLEYPEIKEENEKQPEKQVSLNESLKSTNTRKVPTDLLLEDVYSLNSSADIDQAKQDRQEDIAQAKLDKIEKIVDLDADSVEELQPSYVGKIIIQCPQCMTLFYKDPADIVYSEDDPNVVNINETCQHCGNISGYDLIGKVGAPDAEIPAEASVDTATEPVEEGELDLSFGEATTEVDPEGTGEAETTLDTEETTDVDLDSLDIDGTDETEEDEDKKKNESLHEAVDDDIASDTEAATEDAPVVAAIEEKPADVDVKVDVVVQGTEDMSDDALINAVEQVAADTETLADEDRIVTDVHTVEADTASEGDKTDAVDESITEAVDDDVEKTETAETVGDFQHSFDEYDKGLSLEFKPIVIDDKEYTVTGILWDDGEEGKLVAEVQYTEAVDDNKAEDTDDDKDDTDAVDESLNNSEFQKEAEEGSELKTEHESEHLTINEDITTKELDKQLKDHNAYIDYLRKMIAQEEDALKKTTNEEVKAAIQRRLDAFQDDLKAALPDSVKQAMASNDLPTPAEAETEANTTADVNADAEGLEAAKKSLAQESLTESMSLTENSILQGYQEFVANLNKSMNDAISDSATDNKEVTEGIEITEDTIADVTVDDAKNNLDTFVATLGESVETNVIQEALPSDLETGANKLIRDLEALAAASPRQGAEEGLTEDASAANKLQAEIENVTADNASFKRMLDSDTFNKFNEDIDDVEDIDTGFEDIDTDSINECMTKFLTEVYENVKSFEIKECINKDKNLIIEGTINFKSGKTKDTKFNFTESSKASNHTIYEGCNKDLAEDSKFTLTAINEAAGKILVSESLAYSYHINEALVEGLVK